jgi:hypothetical protein
MPTAPYTTDTAKRRAVHAARDKVTDAAAWLTFNIRSKGRDYASMKQDVLGLRIRLDELSAALDRPVAEPAKEPE